jgi:perosamine synthetase
LKAQLAESLIPIFRPDICEDVIQAVADTLRSRWIGPGPRVVEFETNFASYTGAAHAVSTASGTAALKAALWALGTKPGDEIIIPSFTWASVLQVVLSLGATPVFCDIEPTHLTLDPEDVQRRITDRTKVIVAVHHGGQLCDLGALKQLAADAGIFLLEDAAHACGASYGPHRIGASGSIATCFSFNAMKNLAIGDGGMITTDDPDFAQKCRHYRSLGLDLDTYRRYGAPPDAVPTRKKWMYNIVSEGDRSHMNDIAAAAGIVQLRKLPSRNSYRATLAAAYSEGLADAFTFRSIASRNDTTPSWHMFTVLMPNRDSFVEKMRDLGVEIGVHYHPLHLFPFCSRYKRPLPVTEELWQQVTTFPMYPGLSAEDQGYVIDCARKVGQELAPRL